MICNFMVDGVDHYTIEITRHSRHFTLHALAYPPNSRGGGVTDHHLYSSGEICVASGCKPVTIDAAKAIAIFWCKGWSKYIRGYPFPNDGARVNVNS